jgi:hypothetical protein
MLTRPEFSKAFSLMLSSSLPLSKMKLVKEEHPEKA